MPTVYCSTNLVPLIGTKQLAVVSNANENPRSAWNARLFYINSKKCILFTNKASLYCVVRLNILKKDIADPRSFFIASLFDQLKADQLYNRQEENYWLDNFPKINLLGTDNDKKVIGSMNEFVYQLKVGLTMGSSLLKEVNDCNAAYYLNTIPMRPIKYNYPRDVFRDLLVKPSTSPVGATGM